MSKDTATNTYAIFMDLILCGVGCMLLFFTGQIVQPRSSHWDDRPFLVNVNASPQQVRTFSGSANFAWVVRRPDGTLVRQSELRGAVLKPKEGKTQSGQWFLLTMPEAHLGDWAVEFVVEATLANQTGYLNDLKANDSESKNGFLQSVRAVLEWRDKFENKDKVVNSDYDELLKLLEKVEPDKMLRAVQKNQQDYPFMRYVRYRMLAIKAESIARFQSKSTGKELQDWKMKKQTANDEIDRLLSDWNANERRVGQPQETELEWINEGIKCVEYIRRRQPNDSMYRDNKEYKKVWETKSELIEKMATSELTGTKRQYSYNLIINEILSRKAMHQWADRADGVESSSIESTKWKYWTQTVLEWGGATDPLLALIRLELFFELQSDLRINVSLGVNWGDRSWPAVKEKGGKATPFLGQIVLQPTELNKSLPLLKVRLAEGRQDPEVTLSPRVTERKK